MKYIDFLLRMRLISAVSPAFSNPAMAPGTPDAPDSPPNQGYSPSNFAISTRIYLIFLPCNLSFTLAR